MEEAWTRIPICLETRFRSRPTLRGPICLDSETVAHTAIYPRNLAFVPTLPLNHLALHSSAFSALRLGNPLLKSPGRDLVCNPTRK
jgi:hypothetical protein